MSEPVEQPRARADDPVRLATPRVDDVDARRVRAAVAGRLFGGPHEPVQVGRYQIQGRIGQGGMGIVYRAHDPELARDVAVKLMNAEAVDDEQTATARARLLREARTMARLAHPNVIHVYDVGTTDDGVFIAMELVEGQSLASWQAAAVRDYREVLRCYIDAGRGLAAAHAAGIVHRDFKPENVLVGSDARVRVGDFGLAGASALAETAAADRSENPSSPHLDALALTGSLTRTGALLGTPKYMAPEQERDAQATPRSDQFSFCVALFEGLCGHPPFDGDTIARYRRNVRTHQIRFDGLDSKVPDWVYREILRGLAVSPDDRHDSMDVLLDRLERALGDPRLRKRSWTRRLVWAVPLLLVGVGAGVWVGARAQPPSSLEATHTRSDSVTAQATLANGAAQVPRPTLLPSPTPTPTPADARTAKADASVGPEPRPTTHRGQRPSPQREGSAVAAVSPKPRRGHCYFHEDEKTRIAKRTNTAKLVRDDQGNCYRCRKEANAAIVATLLPDDDCGVKYLCAKEPEASCSASRPD